MPILSLLPVFSISKFKQMLPWNLPCWGLHLRKPPIYRSTLLKVNNPFFFQRWARLWLFLFVFCVLKMFPFLFWFHYHCGDIGLWLLTYLSIWVLVLLSFGFCFELIISSCAFNSFSVSLDSCLKGACSSVSVIISGVMYSVCVCVFSMDPCVSLIKLS